MRQDDAELRLESGEDVGVRGPGELSEMLVRRDDSLGTKGRVEMKSLILGRSGAYLK